MRKLLMLNTVVTTVKTTLQYNLQIYHISSYKALPRIIPATLIIAAIVRRRNEVFNSHLKAM